MSQAWKATERRIADKLSMWWTGKKKAFIRAPCSGGWPSARANGDMVVNRDDKTVPQYVKDSAEEFCRIWSMDVKRRLYGTRGKKKKDGTKEKWSLEELLTAPKHPIIEWWLEMNELAKTRGTYRFLVANKASYHSYVVFGEKEIAYLKGCIQRFHQWIVPDVFQWQKVVGPWITVTGVSPQVPETLTIFEMRSFLNMVDARALGGLGDGSKEEGDGA